MSKDIIRRQMKEQRDRLSVVELQESGRAIYNRLIQTDAYKICDSIFPYMSFRSEVNTKQIIKQALLDGKRVYLPRVNKSEMDFFEIFDTNKLNQSSYGILEPPQDEDHRFKGEEEGKINEKPYRNLMLLPGLAFDRSGNRIGYGAGYYDKYLSSHQKTVFYKLALAYDFQVFDGVEADEFDRKADVILTPTRMIDCH